MPTLQQDPLFHGPDDPCILEYPQFTGLVGRGTVIVCPGGNYEFLSPLEGLPVVEWLAQHNIGAVVLKYRLLPHYDLDDALDDLEAAAARVRESRPGPVAALGFSAGGHLIASLALRAAARGQRQPLDAQILVYPGIDGRDWDHPEYNGFFNLGRWKIPSKAKLLHRGQEALLGGDEFAAPPTCLVGSTDDTCTPNEQHTDIYQRALDERDIPNVYLRDAFGEHGFELKGGWTPGCIKWLKSRNFGGAKQAAGRHSMSLRLPAPRILGESAAVNGAVDEDSMECDACDDDERGECSAWPVAMHDGDGRFPPPPIEAPPSTLASNDASCTSDHLVGLDAFHRSKAIARETSLSSSSSTESVFACTPAPQAAFFPELSASALSGATEGTLPTDPSGPSGFSSSFGAASKPFAKPSGKPKGGSSSLKNLNKPTVAEMKRAAQKAMVALETSDENATSFGSAFPPPSALSANATFSSSFAVTTFGSFDSATGSFPPEPKNKGSRADDRAPGTSGKATVTTATGREGKAAMHAGKASEAAHGRATRGSTTAALSMAERCVERASMRAAEHASSALHGTGHQGHMATAMVGLHASTHHGGAMVDVLGSNAFSSTLPSHGLGASSSMVFDLNGGSPALAPDASASPMGFASDAVEV